MGESSKKILVLGGSSFFGEKLVGKLINQGDHEVTRGNRDDGSSDILKECDFNPLNYEVDLTNITQDYKEGKRQAEAYFYQNASFPVVAVRPSFVIDSNDIRFVFHLNKIFNDEPISVLESSTISIVSAEEVADFLVHFDLREEKSPYCIGETLKISNKLAKSTGYLFKLNNSVI